ncbi:MAG: hypothetical protein S0880_31300 [Actinomycetota bacterium]|nr:hypothetical protein [Actinomycetota bacterium]
MDATTRDSVIRDLLADADRLREDARRLEQAADRISYRALELASPGLGHQVLRRLDAAATHDDAAVGEAVTPTA